MKSLGFTEEHRYFRHPDTAYFAEFPAGPLSVGEEPVKEIMELKTDTGTLLLISPTDCVKDRLTWFYHNGDTECLEQAILVAGHKEIDLKEIKRWSSVEGKSDLFNEIQGRLE